MATVSIWKPLAVQTRASQKARKGRWRSRELGWLDMLGSGVSRGGRRVTCGYLLAVAIAEIEDSEKRTKRLEPAWQATKVECPWGLPAVDGTFPRVRLVAKINS